MRQCEAEPDMMVLMLLQSFSHITAQSEEKHDARCSADIFLSFRSSDQFSRDRHIGNHYHHGNHQQLQLFSRFVAGELAATLTTEV